LRRIHEYHSISASHSFQSKIVSICVAAIFDNFSVVFDWLPLAAAINSFVFCITP
jgi:hypothetical protein